jgi:hypothetical protein
MTLFPSIGGICRALKTRFFSAETVGPTHSELMELTNKTNPAAPAPKKV